MNKAVFIRHETTGFGYLSEQSGALAEYFQLIQQETGSLIPPREAFNPASIPKLLPNILIMELRSEQECVFRLVGSATVDRSGVNPQGFNYIDMVPDKIRARCIRNLYGLFEQPCGSTGLQIESYKNGDAATVEVTSFPFLDSQGSKQIIATATEVFTDALTIPREGDVSLENWPAFRFVDIGAGVPA